MIKDRDIIVTGIQPWDIEIGSNCKNIALEFARHNRVLYVNSPLDRMTLKRNKDQPQVKKRVELIRQGMGNLIMLEENLWNFYPRTILESINGIPSAMVFNLLNRLNNRRFAKEIQKAADELKFKNYILFTDSDMFRSFHLDRLLEPRLTVYYTRDNLLAVDYWKRHGSRMEPALMAKSDLIFANSVYLAELAARHNPESYYVGQGCDLSIYDPDSDEPLPGDLASIPGPVIGYTGALYSLRLDVDILQHIALAKPSWSIVLIGPEDDVFRNSPLHDIPNVHFLGNKKPEELPAYVRGFDVAVNPQKLNEVTRGNYPRKIDEYLAMGKPVVATKTEAMSVFDGYTCLASSAEEYVALIEKALQEDNPILRKERESFARSHTWENSVKEMYKQMERKLADIPKP
jgi:glycosyltransferase involved in cell wall biosynthesis